MNQLTFDYHGSQIRTVIKDGEPWFVAKDVCDVLEIDVSLSVNGQWRKDLDGNM